MSIMKPTINYRNVSQSDYEPFVKTMFLSAGRLVDSNFLEERKESFNPDFSIAAFSNEKIVGTIATRPLQMTIPGGSQLQVAAIGQGGVLPSFTRQGIMRELMTKSLNLAKENGIPAAVWTTSEWPLYGRFGGGVSSFTAEYEISRCRIKLNKEFSFDGETSLQSIDKVKDIFKKVHSKAALQMPGGVPRTDIFWNNVLHRIESGKSLDVLDVNSSYPPALACIHKNPSGEYEGCGIFRILNQWENGISTSVMQVLFLTYTSQNAYRSMWKFILSFDLIETIVLPHRPINEQIRWCVDDGRRILTKAVYDHIWFRILDPIECLRKRTLPKMNAPLKIQIKDQMGFSEIKTVEIFSDGQSTNVTQITMDPDIVMDVACLSSVFMGGISVWDLQATGRIETKSFDNLITFSSLFQTFPIPFTDTSF